MANESTKISRNGINRRGKPQISYMSHRETPKLRPLALPESLNEYFADIAPDLGNVFYFMRKYIAEDETIAKLLKTYDDLPPFRKRDPRKIDLDAICELEGIDKTAVRERVLVAAQRYWGSKFAIDLTMQGKRVMDEMVEVALNSDHPDSQRCKEIILQYIGIQSVPKSAQIINVEKLDQSTTISESLNINSNNRLDQKNELNVIEQMIKGDQERRMLQGEQQEESLRINLSDIQRDSEDAVLVGVGESDYEDDEDDEDDENENEEELKVELTTQGDD